MLFAGDWYPIQVKQKDKVGRPDIDAFEAVMTREDRTKGFFVAFDFSGGDCDQLKVADQPLKAADRPLNPEP